MPKVLFLTHNCYFVNHFLIPQINLYHQLGYTVDLASSLDLQEPPKEIDHFYDIGIKQSPFKFRANLNAFFKLKEIVEENGYDVINCHTPVGGLLGRLLKWVFPQLKIVYTAHGFHFFKGSSKLSWLFFYPVEKFLSRYTDDQITINQEDYDLLTKKKFRSKNKHLVLGVGVEDPVFDVEYQHTLRQQFGIHDTDFVMMSIGQLNDNKNQQFIISMFKQVYQDHPSYKLFILGEGPNRPLYEKMIQEAHLENKVFLVGHQSQVWDYLSLAQVVISASFREGLPKNIMEALSLGIPCLVSPCRGNRDLIQDEVNGYVMKDFSLAEFKKGLDVIKRQYSLLSENAKQKSVRYQVDSVMKEYEEIFR